MGQKTHPYAFRIGIVNDWKSRWFSDKDYTKLVNQDYRIREFLSSQLIKGAVSRIDIETIRGVDCKGVLKNLLLKNLIKIQGRDDSIGKALLYKTTDDYLKHFGISNLNEMPTPDEVSELIESENLT